jgi:hypothetical protein
MALPKWEIDPSGPLLTILPTEVEEIKQGLRMYCAS